MATLQHHFKLESMTYVTNTLREYLATKEEPLRNIQRCLCNCKELGVLIRKVKHNYICV